MRTLPDGVVADAGRDIHPAFVNVGTGLISYRKGEYVKFADDHLQREASSKLAELARFGDIRLSADEGRLYAAHGSRNRIDVGPILDDGRHIGGEGQRFGVGALRVAGSFVAVRENILSLGPFASGSVRVYDLDGSEPPRELCAGERVNDFHRHARRRGGVRDERPDDPRPLRGRAPRRGRHHHPRPGDPERPARVEARCGDALRTASHTQRLGRPVSSSGVGASGSSAAIRTLRSTLVSART